MFQPMTDNARRAMAFANRAAERRQSDRIHGGHILLGLIQEQCMARQVLERLGVDVAELRRTLKDEEKPLGVEAKPVIEAALIEAKRMAHNYVGTEHLLLGLIRQVVCASPDALSPLNVSLESARSAVVELLGGEDAGEQEWRELVGRAFNLAGYPDVVAALRRAIDLKEAMETAVPGLDYEAADVFRERLERQMNDLRQLCDGKAHD
jgi:ATP-dependent Clp protease ATP-binding subunit ClpA